MYRFGSRSLSKLIGVNPLLSYITVKAIQKSKYDYSVFEGVRTIKRQRYLKSIGRSWTMKSKHIYGNAVDLVPYINGKLIWDGSEAKKVFEEIYRCMNDEAKKIGIDLRCGADWRSVDRPHFELLIKDANKYNYLKLLKR